MTLQATVHDQGGQALEGVPMVCTSLPDVPRVLSDAAGELALTLDYEAALSVRPQSLQFRVGGEDWVGVTENASLRGPGMKFLGHFVLDPASSLRGRVVDQEGRPLRGVRVAGTEPRVVTNGASTPANRIFGRAALGTATVTDAKGHYLLRGVPLTTCSVLAHFPGHFLGTSEPVSARQAEVAQVSDVVLVPAGVENRIAGVVLDADGAPRSDVTVGLLDAKGSYHMGSSLTDGEGRFELLAEAGKAYRLMAGRTGHDPIHAYDVPAGSVDVVLRPQVRPSFELRVRGKDGKAIVDFSLQLRFEEGGLVPGASWWISKPEPVQVEFPTRPFRIELAGARTVYFESEVLREETLESPYVAELERSQGLFRGRVLSGGVPVANVKVGAHLLGTTPRTRRLESGLHARFGSTKYSATTEEEGYFELAFHPQAMRVNGFESLHLHVIGPDTSTSWPLIVELPEAGDIPEVVLELVPAGALEGTVRAPAGTDLRGLAVAVSQADGHTKYRELDAAGGFRFDALAPGPWQAVITETRKLERRRDPEVSSLTPAEEIPWGFDIVPGETTRFDPPLEAAPVETGRLVGRFLVDAEVPVGWTWSVRAAEATEQGRFDSEGRFSLGLESAGTVRLHLIPPRSSSCTYGWLYVDLEVHPGTSSWTHDLATASLLVTGLPEPLDEMEANLGRAEERSFLAGWQDPASGLEWQAQFFCAPEEGLLLPQVPAGTLTFKRTEGYVPEAGPGIVLELLPGEAGRLELPGED